MIPVQFPQANLVLGMGQDQYEPLPVHVAPNDPRGQVVFCMRLSPAELEEIARTGTLWISQLTFGQTFQPIALETRSPFVELGGT